MYNSHQAWTSGESLPSLSRDQCSNDLSISGIWKLFCAFQTSELKPLYGLYATSKLDSKQNFELFDVRYNRNRVLNYFDVSTAEIDFWIIWRQYSRNRVLNYLTSVQQKRQTKQASSVNFPSYVSPEKIDLNIYTSLQWRSFALDDNDIVIFCRKSVNSSIGNNVIHFVLSSGVGAAPISDHKKMN